MKKFIPALIALTFLFANEARAQDPQFSQYYAAPMYLNPAFAGANVCGRVSTNIRNQWPAIPGGYVTEIVSGDHFFQSQGVGAGFMFMNDRAGSGRLRLTSISGLMSYEFIVNRDLGFRVGFQPTLGIRSINFNSLIFGDQLGRGGSNVPTVELPTQTKAYFDFSAGVLGFTKFGWLGISTHHLTKPNESLLGDESPLPIKFSLHGGYKIYLDEGDYTDDMRTITPTFNFRSQGKFDQLDIGFYFNKGKMNVGMWYRGIPVFKKYDKGYPNNDALVLVLGAVIDRFNVGYSYDITISWLKGNTAGAHELSMSYQFCKLKKKRRGIKVACPKF